MDTEEKDQAEEITGEKEPETAKEIRDAIWTHSVSSFGRMFNTKAFWIPGLLSGAAGFIGCLVFAPAEPPVRLLLGLMAFLGLWLGVGMTSSVIARRSR